MKFLLIALLCLYVQGEHITSVSKYNKILGNPASIVYETVGSFSELTTTCASTCISIVSGCVAVNFQYSNSRCYYFSEVYDYEYYNEDNYFNSLVFVKFQESDYTYDYDVFESYSCDVEEYAETNKLLPYKSTYYYNSFVPENCKKLCDVISDCIAIETFVWDSGTSFACSLIKKLNNGQNIPATFNENCYIKKSVNKRELTSYFITKSKKFELTSEEFDKVDQISVYETVAVIGLSQLEKILIYNYENDTWTRTQEIFAPVNGLFGKSIYIKDGVIAVGAPKTHVINRLTVAPTVPTNKPTYKPTVSPFTLSPTLSPIKFLDANEPCETLCGDIGNSRCSSGLTCTRNWAANTFFPLCSGNEAAWGTTKVCESPETFVGGWGTVCGGGCNYGNTPCRFGLECSVTEEVVYSSFTSSFCPNLKRCKLPKSLTITNFPTISPSMKPTPPPVPTAPTPPTSEPTSKPTVKPTVKPTLSPIKPGDAFEKCFTSGGSCAYFENSCMDGLTCQTWSSLLFNDCSTEYGQYKLCLPPNPENLVNTPGVWGATCSNNNECNAGLLCGETSETYYIDNVYFFLKRCKKSTNIPTDQPTQQPTISGPVGSLCTGTTKTINGRTIYDYCVSGSVCTLSYYTFDVMSGFDFIYRCKDESLTVGNAYDRCGSFDQSCSVQPYDFCGENLECVVTENSDANSCVIHKCSPPGGLVPTQAPVPTLHPTVSPTLPGQEGSLCTGTDPSFNFPGYSIYDQCEGGTTCTLSYDVTAFGTAELYRCKGPTSTIGSIGDKCGAFSKTCDVTRKDFCDTGLSCYQTIPTVFDSQSCIEHTCQVTKGELNDKCGISTGSGPIYAECKSPYVCRSTITFIDITYRCVENGNGGNLNELCALGQGLAGTTCGTQKPYCNDGMSCSFVDNVACGNRFRCLISTVPTMQPTAKPVVVPTVSPTEAGIVGSLCGNTTPGIFNTAVIYDNCEAGTVCTFSYSASLYSSPYNVYRCKGNELSFGSLNERCGSFNSICSEIQTDFCEPGLECIENRGKDSSDCVIHTCQQPGNLTKGPQGSLCTGTDFNLTFADQYIYDECESGTVCTLSYYKMLAEVDKVYRCKGPTSTIGVLNEACGAYGQNCVVPRKDFCGTDLACDQTYIYNLDANDCVEATCQPPKGFENDLCGDSTSLGDTVYSTCIFPFQCLNTYNRFGLVINRCTTSSSGALQNQNCLPDFISNTCGEFKSFCGSGLSCVYKDSAPCGDEYWCQVTTTNVPTLQPTAKPTVKPTAFPTTAKPTAFPTLQPTPSPTGPGPEGSVCTGTDLVFSGYPMYEQCAGGTVCTFSYDVALIGTGDVYRCKGPTSTIGSLGQKCGAFSATCDVTRKDFCDTGLSCYQTTPTVFDSQSCIDHTCQVTKGELNDKCGITTSSGPVYAECRSPNVCRNTLTLFDITYRCVEDGSGGNVGDQCSPELTSATCGVIKPYCNSGLECVARDTVACGTRFWCQVTTTPIPTLQPTNKPTAFPTAKPTAFPTVEPTPSPTGPGPEGSVCTGTDLVFSGYPMYEQCEGGTVCTFSYDVALIGTGDVYRCKGPTSTIGSLGQKCGAFSATCDVTRKDFCDTGLSCYQTTPTVFDSQSCIDHTCQVTKGELNDKCGITTSSGPVYAECRSPNVCRNTLTFLDITYKCVEDGSGGNVGDQCSPELTGATCGTTKPYCNSGLECVSRDNVACGARFWCQVTTTPVPTNKPTLQPTNKPTAFPTVKPTAFPTNKPTAFPTAKPTAFPTLQPTPSPTGPGPEGSVCTGTELVFSGYPMYEQCEVGTVCTFSYDVALIGTGDVYRCKGPTSTIGSIGDKCGAFSATCDVTRKDFCDTGLSCYQTTPTVFDSQSCIDHTCQVTKGELNDKCGITTSSGPVYPECKSPNVCRNTLTFLDITYKCVEDGNGGNVGDQCSPEFTGATCGTTKPYCNSGLECVSRDTVACGNRFWCQVTTTPVPTAKPTAFPTNKPTAFPTNKPTAFPTAKPTAFPTAKPTAFPTLQPTPSPTNPGPQGSLCTGTDLVFAGYSIYEQCEGGTTCTFSYDVAVIGTGYVYRCKGPTSTIGTAGQKCGAFSKTCDVTRKDFCDTGLVCTQASPTVFDSQSCIDHTCELPKGNLNDKCGASTGSGPIYTTCKSPYVCRSIITFFDATYRCVEDGSGGIAGDLCAPGNTGATCGTIKPYCNSGLICQYRDNQACGNRFWCQV